jgi:uncharacterized membrane protein
VTLSEGRGQVHLGTMAAVLTTIIIIIIYPCMHSITQPMILTIIIEGISLLLLYSRQNHFGFSQG